MLFLALLGAAALRAQTVHWENSDSGDPSDLQLVFEDCEPTNSRVTLPPLDGLTLTPTGTSTQTNIVNGAVSRLYVLSYRARSQRGSPIQIPAMTVDTNKGSLRVAAFRGGQPAAAIDVGTTSTLSAPATTFWAGEVFPLTYDLSVPRRYFNQLASGIDWAPAPLATEDWPKQPEVQESTTNGEARLNILFRTRAYAKAPGRIILNAAQELVNLQTGSIGFGFFQQPRIEQISVTSNRPEFTIRPLPAGAPASFNGAVGQFTLTSKVVPQTAAVGEPITWTLTLEGTGNWPDIPGLPARDVSRDFQVVQPQAKRVSPEGKLFDATLSEDVVLVPTKPGTYTLGPVAYTCFDPKSGTYKTVNGEKFTVTVTAPVTTPRITVPLTTSDSTAAPGSGAAPAKPPVSPGLPGPIPRDPLPGSARAFAPQSQRATVVGTAAPFGVVLLLWLGLALRRARLTDPLRPRREAHRRLAATLAALRSAGGEAERSRLLLAWQHDAATLWKIEHAAPPAAVFKDGAATWEPLWQDVDRALYGPGTALPADWLGRAEAALAARPVNSFSPFQLFLARNLAPFAVCLSLGLAVVATAWAQEASPAVDPLSAYRQGNFAAAEKSWRGALSAHPTDWIARHDLSLALAQQDRNGEAAAQAAAAFVQHPRDPSVRWHLGPSFQKAGFNAPPLDTFVQPGPLQESAAWASPAEWQLALPAAAVLVAVACALGLLHAYGWKSRWARPTALVAVSLGGLLALAAITGQRAYGLTADARAVIAWRAGTLRSIPTEADTAQKTTPLAAGSVALVDKTFLGWSRLSFENGQTGWVRNEDVVPLWK
ncbi:MAG TPA: BatD family protein [Opitutaceae bacterium]|nr:BatD family protein [Opitutaceae bacterium]